MKTGVEAPGTWKADAAALREPVLGLISGSVRATRQPSAAASMAELGSIDKLSLAKLGLLGYRAKGDFVRLLRFSVLPHLRNA